MIPKIIHYCWFGKNPLPKLEKKCIKSWKKHCKEYEVIEWNENNFNIEKAPLYVRQAYEAKKWAFVADYVRLYAMFNYGGIYMDTDVEVIKSLDSLLIHKAFSGFEDEKNIAAGIMGCEKEFPVIKQMLDFYENTKFFCDDGSLNMTTIVENLTSICIEKGFIQNGQFQEIEDFVIYPRAYFYPISPGGIDVKKTSDTVAIHWYTGSWLDEESKAKKAEWIKIQKRNKRYERCKTIKRFPKRVVKKMLGEGLYDKVKSRIIQ